MNKLYKPLFSLFLISVLFFTFTKDSSSQSPPSAWPKFTMTAKDFTTFPGANGQDSIIEWSVYILQTNYGQPGIDPFEFCCAQYNWYFNKNIFQNPSVGDLVLTNRGGQTDLPNGLRPPTFQIDSTGDWGPNTGLLKTSGNLPNSSINYFIGNVFPGTKALRMKLTTNGHVWNNAPLNLRWKLGAAPNTFVAYFTPNPLGPDSANPQYAQSLLDTVANQYTMEGGITPTYPPFASFTVDNDTVNTGGSVNFSDLSTNTPTSWNWYFPGGTPSTSNVQYPTNIIYNAPGSYSVSLRVDNSFGYDSIKINNYITVIPSCVPTWSNFIQMKDAANNNDSLKFGTSPNATVGIDPCFGEEDLPPFPPEFDFRFMLQNPPLNETSKIDIRPEPANDIFWRMRVVAGSSNYPVTLSWDSTAFPVNGTFYLRDEITGTLININMRNQSKYVITNPSFSFLKIVYEYFQNANIIVSSGWNLVSVPLKATDMKISSVFPNASSVAYGYGSAGYYVLDSAKLGLGFWLKFNSDTSYSNTGISVSPKIIPVISGWNIIGPFDEDIQTINIVSNPPGIVAGSYFDYDNDGYFPVTLLEAGNGYWVKTTSAGTLMSNTANRYASNGETQSDSLDNFTKIIVSDSEGKSSTLYLGNASQIDNGYDLPPVPPTGIFDIRFGSDKFVEAYSNDNIIKLNSPVFPVKIKAVNLNGHRLRIKDNVTGSHVNNILDEDTEIEVASGFDNLLLIDENLIPDKFALSQNYPNPFNPVTKIKYQLPVDGNVKIIIYDILGKEVLNLVNKFEQAGSYEITFNASNLASGIYIYKMQSENFTEIKRMILLK